MQSAASTDSISLIYDQLGRCHDGSYLLHFLSPVQGQHRVMVASLLEQEDRQVHRGRSGERCSFRVRTLGVSLPANLCFWETGSRYCLVKLIGLLLEVKRNNRENPSKDAVSQAHGGSEACWEAELPELSAGAEVAQCASAPVLTITASGHKREKGKSAFPPLCLLTLRHSEVSEMR